MGDHAKERDKLERALAIFERAYGRDHPEVAQTLGNLGCAYGQIRRLREGARHAGARARDQGAGVRPRPPKVAYTLGNLGTAYGSLGDHAKARACWSARSRSRSGRTAAITRVWPR